jgi:hypothetical protein
MQNDEGAMSNAKAGHTLPEVLIGTSLTVLVVSAAMTMFIHCVQAVNDAVADFLLVRQSRMVREDLLRGVGSDAGVRQAGWASIDITPASADIDTLSFNVDTNAWPTAVVSDDMIYGIQKNQSLQFYRQPPAGAGVLFDILGSKFEVKELDFEKETTANGEFLVAQLTTSINIGRREAVRTERIRTRILNE